MFSCSNAMLHSKFRNAKTTTTQTAMIRILSFERTTGRAPFGAGAAPQMWKSSTDKNGTLKIILVTHPYSPLGQTPWLLPPQIGVGATMDIA